MLSKVEKGATLSAQIVVHLARLAHGEGHPRGLTDAQWAALRYFASANRASRTLLAFADYHVITRGTASQTVKKLVKKGLLTRKPSQLDGRSSQIDLTSEGRSVFENDPFEELVRGIEALQSNWSLDFLAALEQVMGRIAKNRRRRHFGICSMCSNLGGGTDRDAGETGHVCNLNGLPLQRFELDQICIDYKPDIERH